MSWIFGAGLILLAVAAAVEFLGGRVMRFLRSGPLYLLGAAGAGCLAAAGGLALTGRLVTLDVAGWLGDPIPGQRAAALAADRLSGLFLAVAFGAAVPVSVALASWARRQGPAPGRLGASYALALGSVAVIMTAQDAFTVLFAWEALTLAFYLMAAAGRHRGDRTGAAQVTFAFGKTSGAALLIGLLLLVAGSHSILLASFPHAPIGAARTTAQVLLLAGFAVKAGLVPFQVWLPRGYAAAPGPARAIMAGVCVNVAFYGMWRTPALLGSPPGWLTGAVLLLGAATALLGIAHAAVQNRLSRVIAYSSVENTGLIVTGFGVALTGAAVGNRVLTATGLLAATLQMVAHTIAKSLPGGLVMGALKSPWVLQPPFAGFSILSPSWLWLEMPLMLLLVAALSRAVSGRRLLRVRRVPAWRSATIGVHGLDSCTAFGYANPARRVLAGVLHTQAEVREVIRARSRSAAYAVWTGIGAAGTAVIGMAFLGDTVSVMKLVSIGLVLAGVVGLNLSGVTP
ncbi:MAG TPA: SMR family transporter [Streptosporangiaceae bacterium]|nr:SMR family transporter [Streptosporangiaceae bacterium]HEX5292021.1 SMR family transporter [Streptosporangiaceae bacterium]